MTRVNGSWYEIWADEGHDIPYVLLLRPIDGGVEIFDPAEGNRRVYSGPSYEAARMWLLEDEFVLVGRKEIDD